MNIVSDKQKWTLGFIYDTSLTKVLLVHKEKPEWQKGMINGIGGKYEEGETPEVCIARETREESRLEIAPESWIHVGELHLERGDVDVLVAKYEGALTDAIADDYEEIEWFDIHALPENLIPNVYWLIPLCRERLRSGFQYFSLQY